MEILGLKARKHDADCCGAFAMLVGSPDGCAGPKARGIVMTDLKITLTNTSDGLAVISLQDHAGQEYAVRLTSIDVMSLIGALTCQLQVLVDDPATTSVGLPGMRFVQLVESSEEIYFRVFLGEHLFHEYRVPANTTLAEDLRHFADRVAARQEARVTHPSREEGNQPRN